MHHLTPVGLTSDGKSLVLVSDAGEEYVVAVDLRFRTALRGDNARLGQLEMKMESALRPRDIQARIRAGESAEDVAAAAQTTVEAIMPFAGPVLAERAHLAQTALKASIRRRTNESTPAARTLDEASRQHFSATGVRADDVSWDAWRRDDGRWTLTATYVEHGTEARATFTYDQPGRYVIADDDTACLLTGETVAVEETPSAPQRRLSAVRDDELPLGDDAIELVRGPQPVTDPETAEPLNPTFDDLAADHADADWIADLSAREEPALAEESTAPPGSGASSTSHAPETSEPEPSAESAEAPSSETQLSEPQPSELQPPSSETESSETEAPPADAAKPRKKGRSSVPSWDEIMFGGGGARD